MRIDTQGLDVISDGMVVSHMKLLNRYKEELERAMRSDTYTTQPSSLHTPFDVAMCNDVQQRCAPFQRKVKTVLLVGIGGSTMGTCALYDALLERKQLTASVQLVTFDLVEPHTLKSAETLLASHSSPEEIVLIIISKSGTTLETNANANVLFSLFSQQFGYEAATKQTVVITDHDTTLAQIAKNTGMTLFEIPTMVGGRFSIFTPVSIVPLTLLNVDIKALLEGAQQGITTSCSSKKSSAAAAIASFLFEAYLQGKVVHELFMWHRELETLGKWYRQLLAESIGKIRSDNTPIGITPTIAIGSTDLHSVGQLIFGGRNDRVTTFVSAPHYWKEGSTPFTDTPFLSPTLQGKKSADVPYAIYTSITKTYRNNNLPHISIELENISERELGAFMALQMASIMYLAHLFDINAFDQPAVEHYKKETLQLLHNA